MKLKNVVENIDSHLLVMQFLFLFLHFNLFFLLLIFF